MATYTAVQIKDFTSVPAVAAWSNDKILLYQSTAEAILTSLDLDTTVTGYTFAYNSAVIFLFNILAENPTGLQASSRGKVSQTFTIDSLPYVLKTMLMPFIKGTGSAIQTTQFKRRDMGLR
jgi:hypothetical protein